MILRFFNLNMMVDNVYPHHIICLQALRNDCYINTIETITHTRKESKLLWALVNTMVPIDYFNPLRKNDNKLKTRIQVGDGLPHLLILYIVMTHH